MSYIKHEGTENMKWGYSHGKLNGKRVAKQKNIQSPSEANHNNKNYRSLSMKEEAILKLQETGERILDDILNAKLYKDNRSFKDQLSDPLGIYDLNKRRFENDQNYNKMNRDYWRSQKYKAIRQKLQNLRITEPYRERDEEFIKNYKMN